MHIASRSGDAWCGDAWAGWEGWGAGWPAADWSGNAAAKGDGVNWTHWWGNEAGNGGGAPAAAATANSASAAAADEQADGAEWY